MSIFKLFKIEVLLLGFLILTSTIIDVNYNPAVPIGIGTIYLTDIIIIASFCLIIIRCFVDPSFKIVFTPLDFPLIMFWVVAVLSTLIAILQTTTTLKESIGSIRVVSSYLVFFIVTNLIREERQINTLWRGIFFLAILTTLTMVAQYGIGGSLKIIPGRVESFNTEGVAFRGVTRVIPPGESLILLSLTIITVSMAFEKIKVQSAIKFMVWGLLVMGILLTFKRHIFIGLGITFLILFFLSRNLDRFRIVIWWIISTSAVVILLLSLTLVPGSKASKFVNASFERIASLTNIHTYDDPNSSLRWRDFEYKYSFPQIASHPLIGLGLNTKYRPFVYGRDWEPGGNYTRFIHNGHLAIIVKSGVLGYFFFGWLSLAFLQRGFKYWRDIAVIKYRTLVLSLTLAYFGIMVGSIVSPIILNSNWTPVLGIMFGTNEVIFRKFNVEKIRSDRLNLSNKVMSKE